MFRVGTTPVRSYIPAKGGFSHFKQQLDWFSKTQRIFVSQSDIHNFNTKTLNILPKMIRNLSKENIFSEEETVETLTEFVSKFFLKTQGRIPSKHISMAIQQDSPILVESLIHAGSDPDADTGDDNEENKFPLSTAAFLGSQKHIALLYKCNATMSIDGFQPLKIAVNHQNKEAVKSLRDLGGCPRHETMEELTRQLLAKFKELKDEREKLNVADCLCVLHNVPKKIYTQIPFGEKSIEIRQIISDGSEKYPHDFLGELREYNEIRLM